MFSMEVESISGCALLSLGVCAALARAYKISFCLVVVDGWMHGILSINLNLTVIVKLEVFSASAKRLL